MITVRYLSNAHPYEKSVAEAIAAGVPARSPNPLDLTAYKAYYAPGNSAHPYVLSQTSGIPVYAIGVGNACPQQLPSVFYGKTYTASNNTVHVTGCSFVLPKVEGSKIVTYIPLCKSGTDFKPQAVEENYGGAEVEAVVVYC